MKPRYFFYDYESKTLVEVKRRRIGQLWLLVTVVGGALMTIAAGLIIGNLSVYDVGASIAGVSLGAAAVAWFRVLRSHEVRAAPGTRCMTLLRFFYSEKSFKRVFEPIYADFSYEYAKALARERKGHAWWIRCRLYLTLVQTLGVFGIARAARSVFEYFTEPA